MTAWRRRVRRGRIALQTVFSCVVILFAVVIGLCRLFLPWLADHPSAIDRFLSSRLGRSVQIERAEERWEYGRSVLNLYNVQIAMGESDSPLVIPRAEFSIDFFFWLYPSRTWSEFCLVGLELTLERRGKELPWQLRGLGKNLDSSGDKNNNAGKKLALFQLGAITLKDARLHVDDIAIQRQFSLSINELRLINNGNRHLLKGTIHIQNPASPPIVVIADYDDSDESIQLYAGGENLAIDYFLEELQLQGITLLNGQGKIDLWTKFRYGKLQEGRAEVDLQQLVLGTAQSPERKEQEETLPRMNIDRLSGGIRWRNEAHGWALDIADFVLTQKGTTTALSNLHVEKTEIEAGEDRINEYSILATSLDTTMLANISMLVNTLPSSLRQWLHASEPQGRIEDFHLRFVDKKDFDVSAHLNALSWHSVDGKPGLKGLHANLFGDPSAFVLSLPTQQPLVFDWPRVFRQSLKFSESAGMVALYPSEDDTWRLESPALSVQGTGFAGEVHGFVEIQSDGGRPLVDVSGFIHPGDIQAAHLFWSKKIPDRVVSWLNEALTRGSVQTGKFVLRGDLDDWPFRKPTGRFEARVEIQDLALKYHPKWPPIEHLQASATFTNAGLEVAVASGEVMGNVIDQGQANIPDLKQGELQVRVSGHGEGKSLLNFAKKSPIAQRYTNELLGVDIGGQGQVEVQLQMPLKQIERTEIDGKIFLKEANLQASPWNLKFENASGTVRFNQSGLATDNLAVMYEKYPMNFSLSLGGLTQQSSNRMEARLHGELPVEKLLNYVPALNSYSTYVSGKANWTIGLDVAAPDSSGNENRKTLSIDSNLQGVGVHLPAPLAKSPHQIWPLKLSFGVPLADAALRLDVDNLLHLHAQLPGTTKSFAIDVALGNSMPERLLSEGIGVHGKVEQLDASGWITLLNSISHGDENGFFRFLNIQTKELIFYGQRFANTDINIQKETIEKIIKIKGEDIEGIITIPDSNLAQRGITAQLQRLYLLNKEEEPHSEKENAQPSKIPALHISIDDFRVAQAHYGAARLETNPVPAGMHIEKFETRSPNVDINARGDWTLSEGRSTSIFKIDFTSENLGRMLDALGYAGVVDGGQTLAHLEGEWEGSPASFALAALNGTLNIEVTKGRILEVNPGAGRLLGLLSLAEIPRRLSLDFSDIFSSGMTFESINGLFTLKQGNAFTDNLRLKGPAATIAVRGRTGLKAKDYDQEMEITPHVGGTLPIVGALTGGPVGAAAGFVLQGIFRQPLKNIARARYEVTGSWEKPEIKLIEKETIKQNNKEARENESKN